MSSSHTFTLFVQGKNLAQIDPGSSIVLSDDIAYHRLVRVLRVARNDSIILFDGIVYAYCSIATITKQAVGCQVQEVYSIVQHKPQIIAVLPLLKREDLVDAINGLVQLGVSAIQLIITKKSQQVFDVHKDQKRLDNVVIAACEQSKNFSVPRVLAPISLSQLFVQYVQHRAIFFHPTGLPSDSYFLQRNLTESMSDCYLLIVGPEGDFAEAEQLFIKEQGSTFVRLTPTTLRASTAIQLGVGMFRSLFSFSGDL